MSKVNEIREEISHLVSPTMNDFHKLIMEKVDNLIEAVKEEESNK